MSYADKQYHALLQELVDLASTNTAVENRTDTDAFTLFGRQMRFNLAEGFPLLTTKYVHFKSVVSELLWFLRGDTNIQYLLERNNRIWTDWRLKAFNEMRKSLGKPEVDAKQFEQMILEDEEFTDLWGDIGKGYGHQWRNFGQVVNDKVNFYSSAHPTNQEMIKGFDQISWVINEIKTNPKSRRLIVSGWNPHEVDKVDLPPCHTLFQFHVEPMNLTQRKRWVDSHYEGGGMQAIADYHKSLPLKDKQLLRQVDFNEVCDFAKAPKAKLSCQLYQRSADVFLGVPFNIASYALLTHMVAQVCDLAVGEFIWTGGNTHLYENHLEQAKQQLANDPTVYPAPKISIDSVGKTIFEITEEDIDLGMYIHFPPIKAPVAV